MCSIAFSSLAEKDFSSLPKQYQKLIQHRIDELASEPRPHGVKKLHEGFYRVCQGPYRVIFKIDDRRREIIVERIKPAAYR